MIAGHHHLRLRKGIEERLRLPELIRSCALREVAGHHDHVGFERAHAIGERLEELAIHAAEVQVRKMDDGPHDAGSSLRGTTTSRAAGRLS
jgi:hypothetical protein